MAKGWTCQRQSLGKKCKTHNAPRTRKCKKCGKARPPRKRPSHMKALDLTYEEYVALNGGEFCAVCGRPPSPNRRLDRDHCHSTGKPRGLLCPRHNRFLASWVTSDLLRKMADYLDR